MKTTIGLLLIVLILPLSLLAKPKEKKYNNAAKELFDAALRTARERQVVTFVDEKNLLFTFETGMSMMSYGFLANASIEPDGVNAATLIINVQKKNTGKSELTSFGAGDRMADKFFTQVTEELAKESKQKVDTKPEAAAVVVPQGPVSNVSSTVDDVGTVVVSSIPDGADVNIDGAFVGNTPATLNLKSGKHTVKVSETGYKDWTRDLTTLSGSEAKLNATLEK